MLEILLIAGLGGLGYYLREIRGDITNIRDNHLKHIGDDVNDIKVRVSILENK